jgi:predicted phosphohydrolase
MDLPSNFDSSAGAKLKVKIWAIADLHLSISRPEKSMECFGPRWKNYQQCLSENWKRCVAPQDIVLIAGDICWAMNLEEAKLDLQWIAELPGRKVLSKGNHDYWWESNSKVRQALPPNMWILDGDSMLIDEVAILGVRLWDSPEVDYTDWIDYVPNPKAKAKEFDNQKIFQRELHRLSLALEDLKRRNTHNKLTIAMIHYPPVGPDLGQTEASKLLEKYGIQIAIFGHLHSLKVGSPLPSGQVIRGVSYHFVAADHLLFQPVTIG